MSNSGGGDGGGGAASAAAAALRIAINLSERDIIKLVIEFLQSRELHISQLDLERETGVINSQFSDDVLFLRQLVLDGQWDDVLEFIAPLKQIPAFDAKQFTFIVMKHQYLELLCLKSEASVLMNGEKNSDNQQHHQLSVEQLVAYLGELRQYTPSEDEYKKLCLLVTSPRLQDHQEYRNWNPASGRLQCFRECLPLVARFLEPPKDLVASSPSTPASPPPPPRSQIAQNERLVQLLVKGLLYEACVEYCQARATNSPESYDISDPGVLLSQQQLSETDASLLSWLHALPVDTFSCPFEEKPLKLALERFQKPSLEAQWADAILATPIKPQQLFPYNAVPSGRSRSTELMSRSLAPQYDGLGFGLLGRSQLFASGVEMKLSSAISPVSNSQHNGNGKTNGKNPAVNELTHSIGLFNLGDHLAGSSLGGESTTQRANTSNMTTVSPRSSVSPSTGAVRPIENNSPPAAGSASAAPAADLIMSATAAASLTGSMNGSMSLSSSMHDSQLFNEYKRNKAQILKQLDEQDRKRDEYIKQLKSPNVYNAALNAVSKSVGQQQLLQQQIFQQQQQQQQSGGKLKPQSTMYEVTGGGATETILEEEEEEEEDEDEAHEVVEEQVVEEVIDEQLQAHHHDDIQEYQREDSQNGLYHSPKSTAGRGGLNGSGSAVSSGVMSKKHASFDASSLSPPIDSRSQLSPRAPATPATPYNQPLPPQSPRSANNSHQSSGVKQRPIVETHKFDSLEDITRAASFQPICMIEDQQAIRAVDIHPSGDYYVVGSNSKCLRVCHYPNLANIKSDYACKPASVLYKKSKHHYGSIYCVAWNPQGNLIATGSNDKTIKLVKFSPDLVEDTESESELTCHNGTVRDLIFMHQTDTSLLVSGGAGDCKIHVTDCTSLQPLRTYSGHAQHVYTLYSWPGTKNVFVSGSADKTCRFWDLRTNEAIQVVRPTTDLALQGSPVASVAVDPSGLLLASGHEDAACCLYDIRGARIVQCYKPHQSDIRSIRFSSNAYYLLTASYDNKVIITDLHGDLTKPLNWSVVAGHNDKIIQAKWHPTQMSFVTTSADRTSTVWSLPSAALANASVI